MNRKTTNTIIFFALCIISISCKKWPIDYRNKYIGDYIFTYTTYHWVSSAWVTDLYQTEGEIYYRPFNSMGKTITIKMLSGTIFEAKVSRNGTLKESSCDDVLNGVISTSSISFEGNSKGECNTSKGPTTSYTITGVRK